MPVLRKYQQEAIDAVFSYWERGGPGSPLIELPTGSGKSFVIGELVRRLVQDFDARVLVATHRKELIVQDAVAIRTIWPHAPIGIFSAGLNQKRLDVITVGGIQSLMPHAKKHGMTAVDVVLIDEAHLISIDEDTQYGTLLAILREKNPDLRVIGLTATPYRMGQGLLTTGAGAIFSSIVYRANIIDLVADGFLAPLVPPSRDLIQIDTSTLGTRAGEFIKIDAERVSDIAAVNSAVAKDVAEALRAGRTSALVFASSVKHAEHLCDALELEGVKTQVITGETLPIIRDCALAAFKARKIPCLVSMDVLTTGFDAPCTDVIAIVRPIKSAGLYVQVVGRGMRVCDGKDNALTLDYGENIKRHGPITNVRPPEPPRGDRTAAVLKLCPSCFAEVPAASASCVHCDYEFPPPEVKEIIVEKTASKLDPMSRAPPEIVLVDKVSCRSHISKKSGSVSMCVDFLDENSIPIVSEYVCLEHSGFARSKAEKWWVFFFGGKAPLTVREGVQAWRNGKMRQVRSVTIVQDGKWARMQSADIVDREPGDDDDDSTPLLPAAGSTTLDDVFAGDDLPF